jgi:hypothetical protein
VELTGPGVPLLDGVMQSVAANNSDYESGIGQFAVSRLGTLVFAGGGIYPPLTGSMVRLDRSGAAVDLNFKDAAFGLRLSPDGRRLVVSKRATQSRAFNVELYDLERGTSAPLTSDQSGWPIWSVDGQRVLFEVGGSRIDSVAADGSGVRETVFNNEKEGDYIIPASWSRDGRWLAIILDQIGGRTQILVRPMAEKGEPRVLLDNSARFRIFDPEFSPNSKWIAYTSNETGVDLAAAGGLRQFLTGLSLHRTGANLTDLQDDRPVASGDILPHGAALHRKCLLIVRRNTGIEADAEHFRRFSSLAKSVIGFCLRKGPVWWPFRRVTQAWP